MRRSRRDYEGDVHYEAWRSGLQEPDPDRVYDAYWDDVSPESFVAQEAERQHQARAEVRWAEDAEQERLAQLHREEQEYEEYCRAQEQEYERAMREREDG